MSKIQITLDATKLRNLISNREFQNKAGETVKLQEVKFELVEVKEPKQIYEKDNMRIMKTHFACAIQTKEEREAKANTVYIGEGFTTIWGSDKTETVHNAEQIQDNPENDLPF
jgi:hypothetical protein